MSRRCLLLAFSLLTPCVPHAANTNNLDTLRKTALASGPYEFTISAAKNKTNGGSTAFHTTTQIICPDRRNSCKHQTLLVNQTVGVPTTPPLCIAFLSSSSLVKA